MTVNLACARKELDTRARAIIHAILRRDRVVVTRLLNRMFDCAGFACDLELLELYHLYHNASEELFRLAVVQVHWVH